MVVDIDQIKAFCCLANSPSYKVAADKLCITPPALSKKIQKLEQTMNTCLFERNRSGTTLTSSGAFLLPKAISVVESFDKFGKSAELLNEGIEGKLSIGFGISVYQNTPRLISSFKTSFPNIDISLYDLQSQQQLKLLQEKELDIAFCRYREYENLSYEPLFNDKLALVVHNTGNAEVEPLDYLGSVHYLQFEQPTGLGFSEQLMFYLAKQNIQLKVKQKSDNILTLISMVSANLGFTILPYSARQFSQPNTDFIPLHGESSEWEICMIWNNDNNNPVVRKFIKFVQIQQE